MRTLRQARSIVVGLGVLALAACGGGASSGLPVTAPPGTPAVTPSQVAAASPSPAPQFAPGDMLVILVSVSLVGDSDDGPYEHALLPGDRVLFLNGPNSYRGRLSYEVAHSGIDGWVPVADGDRQVIAFDAPGPNAEVWDLVSFGDSSSPALDVWALRIEKRLGVEVRIFDAWNHGIGGTPADNLRVVMADPAVREPVAEAEVISIELNPGGTTTGDVMGEICGPNDPTPRDPPPAFTIKDFDEFAGLWRQLYDEVFKLRAGRPTVVRAVDMYVPVLDAWKAAGIEAACTAGWEAFSATVKLVAAERKVLVASMYDTFNGLNHDEDPVDKGYIGPDGIHPSELGRSVQVDVLDALGYDLVAH